MIRWINSMWLSYAPMWLWYPVHNLAELRYKILYQFGARSKACLAWAPEHCALLPNGKYQVRFCDEPRGHPKSIAHRSGIYVWKD